jgi:large subunit ribosomal protein L21e
MLKRKRIRTRGKFSFMSFFQKFDSGDSVAIVRELGMQSPGFPKRMQGRTGVVIGKRGGAYIVEVKDINMKKSYIIKPIHLKKIENLKVNKK